jgi:hypothetical protein
VAAVLGVVDVVLEEHLLHLEEGLACEQRIGSGLMLGPDALNLQLVGHFLKAAFEVFAGLHQVLDVVHVGEVELE